jgi:hypothetical protein
METYYPGHIVAQGLLQKAISQSNLGSLRFTLQVKNIISDDWAV